MRYGLTITYAAHCVSRTSQSLGFCPLKIACTVYKIRSDSLCNTYGHVYNNTLHTIDRREYIHHNTVKSD